jgi:hypothetical protein
MRRNLGAGVALLALGALIMAATASGLSGGTITLKSYDQHLRVTVIGWANNAHSSNEFLTPSAGHRFLAVKLKIVNLASNTYDDSPGNGAILEDTAHRQYHSTFGGPDPSLETVRILPHDWVVGWLTFEIPRTAKPRLFAFTLDSGFADNATGVWHFR